MLDLKKREAQIKKRLKHNQKLSLIGFVVVTASAIVAFYTFPSLSTAGWIAIIFAFVTAICWFLPLAMAAAEMATVRGWTNGGIFVWVRNMLGPRWGFLVNWLQFQVTLGFVAIILFTLTSFGFSFGGVDGYNYVNSLKLGTTLDQPTFINYSSSYNPGIVFGIGGSILIIIILIALTGQKTTHTMGQFGFTIGIMLPFLIVTVFAIYTVATMKNPLYFIGDTFQKDSHLSIGVFSDSFVLNRQFKSATVMASFMAFMFSLHGVEVSSVAANRMRNPSKSYPKAMSIVVFLALVSAILGSVVISMAVPSTTLSFTGGIVQYMLFAMSVAGVQVQGVLPNGQVIDPHTYKTLADAYAQIDAQYGTVAAESLLNQFIYGVNSQNQSAYDPITGQQIISLTVNKAPKNFIDGIRVLSFFAGMGTFIEISVWVGNLSNGLCYALEKNHFNKTLSYRLKNGAPATLIVLNTFTVFMIFLIYMFSYSVLNKYENRTITDVLTNVTENGFNHAGLTQIQVEHIRDILKPMYHPVDGKPFHEWVFNKSTTDQEVATALDQIKSYLGWMPVSSGTPASETNTSFISNVIMQVSTYFVGYTIFLISYIKFIFKSGHLNRNFKIKSKVVQMTFALMALCTTLFAAIATYLPSSPELYPGTQVYELFLEISLPIYISFVLLGLVIYQLNKWRRKRLGLNIYESDNIQECTLEQLDLVINREYYEKQASLSEQNFIDYRKMVTYSEEINALIHIMDSDKDQSVVDEAEERLQIVEEHLYQLQYDFYHRNLPGFDIGKVLNKLHLVKHKSIDYPDSHDVHLIKTTEKNDIGLKKAYENLDNPV